MGPSGDISCKQLFGHPEVVRELLRAATPFPWLDAAGIRRCNGNYVTDQGTRRQGDMVWRLRQPDGPPCYLLLEFQTHPDYWMALRMQVYAGLLCQDLLRQQQARGNKLPLLLPLVLYTGRAAWNATTDLHTLHAPSTPYVAEIQPEQKYLLVDQSNLRAKPEAERSVLASLLEFEQASDEVDLLFALKHVNEWAERQRDKALSQFIRDWVVQRLRGEFAGLAIPEEITLLEVHAMFNHRFSTPEELWQWQAEQRAEKKGLAAGWEKGREAGWEQGREEGREEGREKGREEGRAAARRQMVRRLLERTSGNARPGRHIEEADAAQLEAWIEELLDGHIPAALR